MPNSLPAHAVAVIGMAGRFPGAACVAEYWRNLRAGLQAVTFFTEAELLAAGVGPEVLARPDYVRAKPVLDGIDEFDAEFFRISPREAELTDPQQRIFLECAWEALEDAGHDPFGHPGRIGIFASAGKNTYLLFNLLGQADWSTHDEVFQLLIGNEKDYLATRVAYLLHLTGPAVTVQTACSSSLVAVHMACQSLALGECDLALAGGVNVDVPRVSGYVYRPGGILSPDGRCRPFTADPRGTVFGQGAGVVVLRRLADALDGCDRIRAVVRGSAVNNDGGRSAGFTAPSQDGQTEVIAEALAVAGVRPASLGYVQAHGTATPLGDAIELRALEAAFHDADQPPRACAVGSVKANVGHLGAAAGVAGLMAAVLALENREIPPSPHGGAASPQLGQPGNPFYLNGELRPWPVAESPGRAGVSSFGQGGTNAHVVLEEAPGLGPSAPSRPWHVLAISARSPAARDAATRLLAEALPASPFALADIAYTLHVGRKAFAFRRIVVGRSKEEMARALTSRDPAFVADGHCPAAERPVAFAFPPLGTGEFTFPTVVHETEPIFRGALEDCRLAWHGRTDPDPAGWTTFAAGGHRGPPPAHLVPALSFAVQYALAKLWLSWGVKPGAFYGRAGGAFVAAAVQGRMALGPALSAAVEAPPELGEGLPEFAEPGAVLLIAPRGPGAPPARVSPAVPLDCGDCPVQVLGMLWLRGAALDRAAYYAGEQRRRVPLPTYPFQRRRYWIEAPGPAGGRAVVQAGERPAVRPGGQADPVEAVVAQSFQSALGVEGVKPEDNFFELGGESLQALLVVARIKSGLGVEVGPDVLYERPTVAGLADVIRRRLATDAVAADAWAEALADVALDASVTAAGRAGEVRAPPGRVLLTGATGFFGSHVLEQLLASTSAGVDCLVRARTREHARERVARALASYRIECGDAFWRVNPIPADLEAPGFGLAPADHDVLAQAVDAIYHCAGQVNYLKPYRELARANVGATREVLRLAATGRPKAVHHVSSVAVFAADSFAPAGPVSEDTDLSASRGFRNGYDLTKWVAERVVAIARDRAIPVSVYRLSNVTGHSHRAVMAADNIIVCFLKGCIQLGLAPAEDQIINLLPVDAASALLVGLSLQARSWGRTFHVVHPQPTRVRDVVAWLTARGYRLRACGEDEWRKALREAPDDNAFKPFLPLAEQRSLFSNRRYDRAWADALARGVVPEAPPVDERLFDAYLSSLIDRGIMK
jgi:thioester reductase-like protein